MVFQIGELLRSSGSPRISPRADGADQLQQPRRIRAGDCPRHRSTHILCRYGLSVPRKTEQAKSARRIPAQPSRLMRQEEDPLPEGGLWMGRRLETWVDQSLARATVQTVSASRVKIRSGHGECWRKTFALYSPFKLENSTASCLDFDAHYPQVTEKEDNKLPK